MARTALVAGATGLVGSALLRRLLADPTWGRVVSVGRRPSGQAGDGLVETEVDFDDLGSVELPLTAVDDAFCCLGTTRKKAGSLEAFERVDRHYVVAFGRLAKSLGAHHLVVVSSMLADPESSNDYTRVKGRMERDLEALALPRLTVVRPSLLLGRRQESRPLETASIVVARPMARLFIGPLKRFRPVTAAAVAATMARRALGAGLGAGVDVVESDDILEG